MLYPIAMTFPSGLQAIPLTITSSAGGDNDHTFCQLSLCSATSPKKTTSEKDLTSFLKLEH